MKIFLRYAKHAGSAIKNITGKPMKSIFEIFENYDGPRIYKWSNYVEIYDNYFSKYRGQEIVFLEIGIAHGGSLKFWREYFGEKALIFGIDVNPECKQFEEGNTKVLIGSQQDVDFLEEVKKIVPKIDILLDDGGHTMKQQNTTFDLLFDHVKDNGIYMCEDVHTSYWKPYGGGYKRRGTFLEKSKDRIDNLFAWHVDNKSIQKKLLDKIAESTWGIHFYDSIVVYLKKKMSQPQGIIKGKDTINDPFRFYGQKRPFYKPITNFLFRRNKSK